MWTKLLLLPLVAMAASPDWPDTAAMVHKVGQHGGYGGGSQGPTFDDRAEVLLRTLARARRTCGQLDVRYQVPCLYTEYDMISRDIRRDRDLAPVSEVLRSTAGELRASARKVQNRAAPRVRVSLPAIQGAPARVSAPLLPLDTDAATTFNQAAADDLSKAGITLLRSIPTADPRRANFERVDNAFEGTAVLLRSG